jgi:predicted DNA-binding transcriptional regulator AlpA
MKNPSVASRLKAIVRAAPPNCTVYVCAKYSHHFKVVPKDGRTYIVQDPRDKRIHHWTYPDRKYFCEDEKNPSQSATAHGFTQLARRVQYQGVHGKKLPRVAGELSADSKVQHQSEGPLIVSLIDINRVMRICGFKKSFIYAQVGFPAPVRLGTSRRSAVRWIENEIVAWVTKLASMRISSGTLPTHKNARRTGG